MLTLASVWTFLSGAKRWLTAETSKAILTAIGVVGLALAVYAGIAAIYGAGGAASEARVNWKWLYEITQANEKHAKQAAEVSARAAAAAEDELVRVKSELEKMREARLTLEHELSVLKDNPQIYTRDERRRLFPR